MLHFLHIEMEDPQNLRVLVDDAVTLIKILKRPLPLDTLQTVPEYNPFHHFCLHIREKWSRRQLCISDAEINKLCKNYGNSLCDALFGLWNLPDQKSAATYDDKRFRSVASRRNETFLAEFTCGTLAYWRTSPRAIA